MQESSTPSEAPLRVVFMGSPEFAVPSLRALSEAAQISLPLVITQPDRPAGRGRQTSPPAVKSAALEIGLPILQPTSMQEPEAIAALRHAAPDLLVVVAYGELLRRAVREAAPHGALNVHPSLLPRYRGAAPIPAAILNGDTQTGVSIIQLVRRLDAGPLIAQESQTIAREDTTATLAERLAHQAAGMLPLTCLAWSRGDVIAQPQDEAAATYTREWTKEQGRIDWRQPADAIERLIRAAQPWPIAWTMTTDEQRLQLLRARPRPDRTLADVPPGGVVLREGQVRVQTGVGILELLTVQPAGKRAMPAMAWLRGLHTTGVRFM